MNTKINSPTIEESRDLYGIQYQCSHCMLYWTKDKRSDGVVFYVENEMGIKRLTGTFCKACIKGLKVAIAL